MRRLLGLKDSTSTPSSNVKGKEYRRDAAPTPISLSNPSPHTAMEVHVNTEVHSAPDRRGFHPLGSRTSSTSSSPASSNSRPLPPEIRVPTHPYPYWQGYTQTPSSSSQSSLGSPMTPSHVSWLSLPNIPGNSDPPSNGSNVNLSLNNSASAPHLSAGPSSSTHSLLQGRSTPSPHFPPPPPTNPPPNMTARPKLHTTKSSHSLRVPVQEYFNQQLSPIVEQDYLSPEKRPTSLPSSSHEGGGSRLSTAHTARSSMAPMTPVSPGSDVGTATVTPVTPVPITPVLMGARGTIPTSQTQTPVSPSHPGGVVPFARRKDDDGSDSPRPSPVSTFILRPLNRSISLSSTRTHQSGVSVTPPVIPPLDLKPEFRGPAFLATPTSPHSRRLLDVVARDDDSVSDRRESFITAQTGAGRESKYSLGQDEVFMDAEDGYRRDSDGTIHAFDTRFLENGADTSPTSTPGSSPRDTSKPVKPPIPARTIMHPRSASRSSSSPPSYNPSGPQNSDNYLVPTPQAYLHPHRPVPSPSLHPSRLGASAPSLGISAPSLQDLGTSVSASSSFVDRRFASSSFYIRPSSERESERARPRWTSDGVDTVQVLFWLGFIAPWCWLIGGWLITTSPPLRGYNSGGVYGGGHHGSSLLPLWTSKSKSMQSFDTTKMQHGYPFVAPSVHSLMPPPPPYYGSQPTALTPKPVVVRGRMKNSWVRRCRIAAVTSGIVIVIVFVVALVVVGTSHGRCGTNVEQRESCII